MERVWQLQEAKNKLSEVVERANQSGPQEITRHGKKAAVILSMRDYRKMKKRKGTLVDFFRNSPLGDLSFDRTKDLPRRIEL